MARLPLKFATVGDLVLDAEVSPHIEREDADLIAMLRDTDVTVGNFETTIVDTNTFDGWPEAEPGGSWLVTSPRSASDLADLGVDMVSRANNHATDWSVAGLRSTTTHLDAAGIVHAGAGATLAGARQPAYFPTQAGRVALVSVATRFQTASRATDAFGAVPARPGINGIRSTRVEQVSAAHFATLRAVRDSLPVYSHKSGALERDDRTGTVTIGSTRFALAESEEAIGPKWELDTEDVSEFLLSVRQARQTADFVMCAIHTHEPGNLSERPPEFLEDLARQAIDMGADAVLGHGPHQVRAVEMYNGRPIFYSLGNFIFMQNRQWPLTAEAWRKTGADPAVTTPAEMLEMKRSTGPFRGSQWYESVMVRGVIDGGRAAEIELVPVDLNAGSERHWDRGIPSRATGSDAVRILEHLRGLSAEYGTEIEITADGIGRIVLPAASTWAR